MSDECPRHTWRLKPRAGMLLPLPLLPPPPLLLPPPPPLLLLIAARHVARGSRLYPACGSGCGHAHAHPDGGG